MRACARLDGQHKIKPDSCINPIRAIFPTYRVCVYVYAREAAHELSLRTPAHHASEQLYGDCKLF